jgi:hypothetical protein
MQTTKFKMYSFNKSAYKGGPKLMNPGIYNNDVMLHLP